MDARSIPPPPLPPTPPKVVALGGAGAGPGPGPGPGVGEDHHNNDGGDKESRKALADLENEYMRARHALHTIHTAVLSRPLTRRQGGAAGGMMVMPMSMAPSSSRHGSAGYLSSPVPPPPPPPPAPPLQAPTRPASKALTVRRPEGMSSPAEKRRRAEAANKYTHAGRALASILLQVWKLRERSESSFFVFRLIMSSDHTYTHAYIYMYIYRERERKRARARS